MIASPAGSLNRTASLFGCCCAKLPFATDVLRMSGLVIVCSNVPLSDFTFDHAATARSIALGACAPACIAATHMTEKAKRSVFISGLTGARFTNHYRRPTLPHLDRRRSRSGRNGAADGRRDGAYFLHHARELVRIERLTAVR